MREVQFKNKTIRLIDEKIILFDLRNFFSNPTPNSYLRILQERKEAERLREDKKDAWVVTKDGLRFILSKLDATGKQTLREIAKAVYGDDDFLDAVVTTSINTGTGGSILEAVRNLRQSNLDLTLRNDALSQEVEELRRRLEEYAELERELSGAI